MIDPKTFTEVHLQALAARSGEPIVTEQDEAEARAALASVFALVQFHGSSEWSVQALPGVAHQVLIEASARLFMNLGGFVNERADAVSLTRLDEFARGASLTPDEIARLEAITGKNAGRGSLRAVGTVNTLQPVMRSGFGGSYGFWQPVGPYYSTHQLPIPHLPGDEKHQGVGQFRPNTRPGLGGDC